MTLLKFSTGNAKLGKRLIFSLPAGYTCPNAGVCKTFSDRVTGKIKDLPQANNTDAAPYRCFAASSEARSPQCRAARWHNFDLLKATMVPINNPTEQIEALQMLITQSIDAKDSKSKIDLVRIHESGDFWSELYFLAWLEVARNNPARKYYAYTKQLQLWLNNMDAIPSNFYLTASQGGNLDPLLKSHAYKFVRVSHVVYSQMEADGLGLSIDHDDSHCFGAKPFALLVHGTQPKGSVAGKSIQDRKRNGDFVGYHK
jgi:hypothetical protein